MFNIVEYLCEDDDIEVAPCKHGNIVKGHACYCHKDDWKEGPRKCPIWREFGSKDKSKWFKRNWDLIELPMFKGYDDNKNIIVKNEMHPCMPDDDKGGCPYFEPS